jgi:cytochrome c-type biogenesis protein CcmH
VIGTFWIIAALFVALAMVIMVLPLRGRAYELIQSDEIALRENVMLYRERLADLDADRTRGAIDEMQHATLARELARTLLADAAAASRRQRAERTQGKGLVLLLAALLPVIAVAAYLHLGALTDWRIAQQLERMSAMPEAMAAPLRTEIAGMITEQLAKHPNNLHYRVMLARYYMGEEKYDEAVLQFRFLAEMLPGDDEAQAYFAQALYLAGKRDITPETQAAIDRTLAINPHNSTVLGMLGINAFEHGDYRKAIDSWQKVVDGLPIDSKNADMLRSGIERAKQKLAERGETWEAPATPAGEGITVSVTMGGDVKATPDQSVFIYAKAAQGPKMPLAVQRISVKQLPVTVTLTDAMAMMPAMKLSSFDEVVIGARVSQSGQAIAGPGDWIGESSPLKWREHKGALDIVISRQLQ